MIKLIFSIVKNYISIYSKKRKWIKLNSHNRTSMGAVFNPSLVDVGKETYGRLNVINFSNKYKLTIGNYCSIATEVYFVVCGEHKTDCISTYPYKVQCLGQEYEATSKGNIVVDDDVWIGHNATILSGVHIGQGAVIAAGAVVNSDVPPYSVVGGVPAKVIKERFSKPTIDYLLTLDYGALDQNMIREHEDDLYASLVDISTDEIIRMFNWFPKR